MSGPFTPEQEARLREIVRDESDEDDIARRIWDGTHPEKARFTVARNRRILDGIREGASVGAAIAAADANPAERA